MILASYAFALAFFMLVDYKAIKEPAYALAMATLASIIAWDLQQLYYGMMATIDVAVIFYLWLVLNVWNSACKAVAALSALSIIVNAAGYGLYMAYEPPAVYNFFAWAIIASQLSALWIFRHGRLCAKPTMGTLFRFISGNSVQHDCVTNPKEEKG